MIKSARIKFDKLLGETPKAYLLNIQFKEHWIPKSLCRNFITNHKLGGNVILPTFIINQILDCDINEVEHLPSHIQPAWVIEKHIPEKITIINSQPNKQLLK